MKKKLLKALLRRDSVYGLIILAAGGYIVNSDPAVAVYGGLGRVVEAYCGYVNEDQRAMLRETVNQFIAPNSVLIECAE